MAFQKCIETFVQSALLIFLWMYLCVSASGLNSLEDFEGNTDIRRAWSTSYGSAFVIVNGSKGHVQGAPDVDTTFGTGQGQYCIASYGSPSQIPWLFSSCYMPSNPKCTIQFSGYINIQPDEEFHVCAMRQCDLCQPIRFETCFNRQFFNRTNKWTVLNVTIGFSPTPFDISFGAVFLHPGSFVALDDIKVMNCHTEETKPEVCGENEVFRCNHTKTCIARDQLCDLHPDCPCGEDEMNCETIPPEGLVTLSDCSLNDGSCMWYNAKDGLNNISTLWTIHNNGTPSSVDRITDDFFYYDGPYLSVEVPPFPSSAILRSVSLKPRYAGDRLCQIRFHYLIASRNSRLQVILLEVGKGSEMGTVRSRTLWDSDEVYDVTDDIKYDSEHSGHQQYDSNEGYWERVVRDLNEAPINVSYVLQFKVTSTHRAPIGHVLIRSLSLGRECFTPDITMTTCDFSGSKGPRQEMCDGHHQSRNTVNVIEKGHEAGVQTWHVPETQIYRIQAYGASGGLGIRSKTLVQDTRGTKVTATFKLTAGTVLYFLVGHNGSEACPQDGTWNNPPPFCRKNATFVGGGGGGGGGATIVYQKDSKKQVKILMVAGGGGGLPFELKDDVDLNSNNDRRAGKSFQSTAISTTQQGHKDSTSTMLMSQSEAESILEGPLKGSSGCRRSSSPRYWGGSGGFGAGGGACAGGGHGGGADDAASSSVSSRLTVGLPGLSFVNPKALSSIVEVDSHGTDGMANVESLWFCPCAYRCMWKGPSLNHPICLCPKGSVLQEDGFSCDTESVGILDEEEEEEETSDSLTKFEQESHITVIVLAIFIVFAVAFSVFCICVYMRRSTIRNGLPIRSKKTIQILCPCLNLSGRPLTFNSHVLPQITNPPAVMHENSIYNRVTTKSSDQVLNEIPRKHLKLIGELGQGAFGEVFYGLLSHMPMVEGDLPVAVKTLPVVCTEQTEMDFLLEALIVSKFNHPNIVKYIGTCFDQHPHYLILELLEGGDLKSFLHQARPKRDVPSTITVIDLLRLSLDIARGCQHLEEKHFIHRDIAARNCLLTSKGPNRIAKIADFGMARDIYRSDYYKKAGRAMLPVKWMPPEAFLDGIFTSKTDAWSYGIVLWEIFSLGHMPYPGCSNEEVMNLVTTGGRLEPPAGCIPSVFDIMTSCWATVAETRPNFGLIISVLERTIQDDETSSRCLPFYYTPPVIHSKRICIKNANRFSHEISLSKGACGHSSDQSSTSRHSKLQVNFEKEQSYLEPLISRTRMGSSAT